MRLRATVCLLSSLACLHAAVAADAVAPVQAFITIQDSENLTEASLDTASLKRIEQWIIERTLARSKQSYANQGFDPKTFRPLVEANSVYALVGGKKLAVVRLTLDKQVRAMTVLGFNRGDFLRVSCVRASNHDISMFSGPCGDKVTEAFGVSVKPQLPR